MTYEPILRVQGHDAGCAVNHLEPCDCAHGIVVAIKLAFALDLQRITEAGRRALDTDQ